MSRNTLQLLIGVFTLSIFSSIARAQDAAWCTRPGAYTFTSINDGNWSSPSTWAGNVAPGTNLATNQTVLIRHVVTRVSGHTDFFPASGSVIVIARGGRLNTRQIQMENASTFIIDNGTLHVQQNFQQKHTNARVCGIQACIEVEENYQIESGADAYYRTSGLNIGMNSSGNLDVPSGGNTMTGSDLRIWLRNGNLANSSTWTADIEAYRVSGSVSGISATYLPSPNVQSSCCHSIIGSCLCAGSVTRGTIAIRCAESR